MTNPIHANSYYNMKKKKSEKMIREQQRKWTNPREHYLNSFLNHESLKTCPECQSEITYSDEDQCEAYCTKCGLVTSASIRYVAGQKIDLPYGLRL